MPNTVKTSYENGVCPDCGENIPDDVDIGDACSNCSHVFYSHGDYRYEAKIVARTEEVCDECGSANIGYDAWVKNIDGTLEIMGGPYDNSQCLNELCQETDPNVRNVLIEDLKYCDGKDCSYHGDKSVMIGSFFHREKKSNKKESYWYCTTCMEENF